VLILARFDRPATNPPRCHSHGLATLGCDEVATPRLPPHDNPRMLSTNYHCGSAGLPETAALGSKGWLYLSSCGVLRAGGPQLDAVRCRQYSQWARERLRRQARRRLGRPAPVAPTGAVNCPSPSCANTCGRCTQVYPPAADRGCSASPCCVARRGRRSRYSRMSAYELARGAYNASTCVT
jgi:hypothetical protein